MESPARPSVLSLWPLVVALLATTGLIAWAAPAANAWLIEHRARQVTADLRGFAGFFHSFATERGDWPPGDGTPAAIPAGMESLLDSTPWVRPTAIGGHYAWEPNSVHQGLRHRAAITIVSTGGSDVSRDFRQLLAVDRLIDDGDLATGRFQLGYRNQPLLILEH